MESDDDMHDANDLESVDEDFYSDGEGYGYGDAVGDSDADLADYDFMGNESDDSDDLTISRSQVHVICILKLPDFSFWAKWGF